MAVAHNGHQDTSYTVLRPRWPLLGASGMSVIRVIAPHRNVLLKRRGCNRNAKYERRVFCPCELCRLRFGRLLYPRNGGEPLGVGRKR